MNGMCMAAIAGKLGLLSTTAAERESNCFIQRQMGYIFNHKCADDEEHGDSSCNTSDSEGFSYVVGCGPRDPPPLNCLLFCCMLVLQPKR